MALSSSGRKLFVEVAACLGVLVTVTDAPQRIAETVKPFLNCPFNPTGET